MGKFRRFGAFEGGSKAVPQVGALCYRKASGSTEVLLITSRTRGRWIIPKGWCEDGMSDAKAAAQEAWEEAGVRGTVSRKPVGQFGYIKLGDDGDKDVPCIVTVYGLRTKSVAKQFPERRDRTRKWLPVAEAARRVDDPGLAEMIAGFDPKAL